MLVFSDSDVIVSQRVTVAQLEAGLLTLGPAPLEAPATNVMLTTTSKAFATANKVSGTIATSGSGTWTATASVDWITINASLATRAAGLPVVYNVAANTSVEERTGYIYVSGHVFTVTQPGVGATLAETSAEVDAAGGEFSFMVNATAQASWRARSNVDWISVEMLCGTGECEVVYHVAPFYEVTTRSGTITAAGCIFTVNQTGRHIKVSPATIEKDYLAHDLVLSVDALSSTEWGLALDASWLSIVDAGSGLGGGSVALALAENPSYLSRTATVKVGSETVQIVQQGRPTAALSFAISPETTTASVKGANGLIAVEATPDLPWTATSKSSWITVLPSMSAGTGNGNVVYAVSPNPTMAARSGSVEVAPASVAGLASHTHSVTQPAAESSVSATTHALGATGGSFDIDVTVDDVVNWSIASEDDWIEIVGDLSRVGPGKVTVTVSENLSVEPRSAVLTIAGHEITVNQSGRSVQVEYISRTFGPEGSGDEPITIEVHPDGNASWTAVSSDPSFIVIWSDDENCTADAEGNVYGTGDATISYMVAGYVGDGQILTGSIQIGDKTVYISQRGYDFTIDPCATNVTSNAGAGTIAVPATEDQVWNAIATEPWIKLVGSYDEVTGSGIVNYTFTDNDTGATRTGKIVIAGEEYTVTQAAWQMVEITVSKTIAQGGLVSGGGTYNLGTSVELAATPNDGYAFVRWECPDDSTSESNPLTVTADVDKEIVAVFRMIPVYTVNGETIQEGTIKTFSAPDPVILSGTTQLVCLGTSAYPNKGTSFQIQVTGNISFNWDLWQTNYWVAIEQSEGGTISGVANASGGLIEAALPGWVTAGREATFTATPAAGKAFYRWSGLGGVASNGSCLTTRVSRPLTISAIFGTFADTLATAADAPTLTFTTGGDAHWLPVIDATAQTGYSSVRSGAIGAESESWLETTVSNAGTLSFRWRTDCEHDDSGSATWDRLAVFTNGVEAARLDGTTDWQTVSLLLAAPKTTIRWSFYRDDFDNPNDLHENAVWLDGIKIFHP